MARVLDATEQCVARFGLRRTSMSDIAREMKVARTTLYRQVSSVEEAVTLAASRQLYRYVDEVAELAGPGATPELFIQAACRAVEWGRSHPILLRVLHDEPDVVGELVTGGQVEAYLAQVSDALAPIFEAAMKAGSIRRSDAGLAAETMVRLVATLLVAPGSRPVEELVEFVLRSTLEPEAMTPTTTPESERSNRS